MKFTIKHLDAELIAYIDEAKNLFERRARMIAVKLKEVGVNFTNPNLRAKVIGRTVYWIE